LSSWKQCTQGFVLADAERYPLSEFLPSTEGFSGTTVLSGRLPVSVVLRLLHTKESSALELCGVHLPLELEQRRAVLDFMRSFKALAERYRTWDSSVDRSRQEQAPGETRSEKTATPAEAPPAKPEAQ